MVTDSGLGGLSVCAGIERAWRDCRTPGTLRLTYLNAWPFEGRGYNDLPDMPARAGVFDTALSRMVAAAPARILIACNTLSIVYRHTRFAVAPAVPVHGIIEAGVELFRDALASRPDASLLLLGTKTTIESAVHQDALVGGGVAPHRIAACHCHGLAGSIERDPDGAETHAAIEACAARAAILRPQGSPVLAALCCTHFGYVALRLQRALAAATGRPVECLDPNLRMVEAVGFGNPSPDAADAPCRTLVEVVSKVALGEAARVGIGRLVAPVSPATAQALLSYSHVPDLF
jgi:glutamate racemase